MFVIEHLSLFGGEVIFSDCVVITHKYRGLQQSSREVKPKFIDSTQGETKNTYKP